MHFTGGDTNRLLHKDDNTIVQVGNECIIEYTGVYYVNRECFITTHFVGKVKCQRYNNNLTRGIFIQPQFVLLNQKWRKIVNFKEPSTKYFKYPHLLSIPEDYSHYNSLFFLDTITNNINPEIEDENIDTIELYYGEYVN